MNPNYFVPLSSPSIQMTNHQSITYQCLLLMVQGLYGMETQNQFFLWLYPNDHGWVSVQTGIWQQHLTTCTHGFRGRQWALKYIYEALSQFSKKEWAFLRSLSGQTSNPVNEVEFQAKLYKNIDLNTTRAIIKKLTVLIVPCKILVPWLIVCP